MPPVDYLTLNGTPIPCKAGGGLPPSRYGETVRMYNNRLRSTEEPLRRTRLWSFTTAPLTGAEWAVIRPLLVAVGAVAAGGYAITRGTVTVACLVIPGEIPNEPDGDTTARFVASFQLLEQSSATALVGGPTSTIYLESAASSFGAGYRVAKVGGALPGEPFYDGVGGPDPAVVIDGCACPGQCAPLVSLLQKWITEPLLACTLFGLGYLASSGIFINPWGTWYRASLGMQVSLVRAGVVVAGPFPFTTSGTSFSGGPVSMQLVSPLVNLPVLDNDRLMFQQFTVMGMNCGTTDDGFRPSMGTGGLNCGITMPGNIVEA